MNAGVVTARLSKEKPRVDALEEARVKSIDSHNAQYGTVRIMTDGIVARTHKSRPFTFAGRCLPSSQAAEKWTCSEVRVVPSVVGSGPWHRPWKRVRGERGEPRGRRRRPPDRDRMAMARQASAHGIRANLCLGQLL